MENLPGLDRFQLISHLFKFSIEYGEDEDTEKMRTLLKKAVVEELLKTNISDKDSYESLLIATRRQLHFGAMEKGYGCCFAGCRFIGEKHYSYVRHVKQCHPNVKDVLCNFKKKCLQRFVSVESLINHLKSSHSAQTSASSSKSNLTSQVVCKCNRLICNGRQFDNTQLLMTHWNCYHNQEIRDCIFLDCSITFDERSTSRHHFRTQHKLKNKMSLKPRHLLMMDVPNIPIVNPVLTSSEIATETTSDHNLEEFVDDDYGADQISELETLEATAGDAEGFYRLYYADFLNRMETFKHVPVTTVQEISDEYLSNTKKCSERREMVLRESLGKIQGLQQSDIEKVVMDVIESDPFLDAQMSLNTDYKRKKFIKEEMNYIGPQEIVLNKQEVKEGKRKDVYHYVPMTESFRALLEDQSMIKMMKIQTSATGVDIEDQLSDLKQGTIYKNSEFFTSHPDAFAAMIYSDGVEIKNPLGAARGRYKIIQVFYTLAEIDKGQRSKIDRIQLLMVFRESLLKKYSMKKIFKPLIDDLKKLENGIQVDVPVSRIVRCGLLCYSADNLEAHTMGKHYTLSL